MRMDFVWNNAEIISKGVIFHWVVLENNAVVVA
jgi:hypothetical protein